MTAPTRSPEPRRQDDAVLRTIASQTFNDSLNSVLRRVLVWIAISGLVTVGGVSWVASAWATNRDRDTRDLDARVTAVERAQAEQLQAMKEQTQAMANLTRALDSVRFTIRGRAPENPLRP